MSDKSITITFDSETVPSIDPKVHARIAEEITPPGNISKAETIMAWHAEKKPALVHEAILKTALDGALGSLAVIGVAVNDEPPVTFFKDSTQPHQHEAEILREFFAFLKDAYNPSMHRWPLFVGHNIVGFDLRFLFKRAVILGVQPPAFIPFDAKPWDETVYDNMVRFAGHKEWISQDKLSRALGQPGKGDIDGSQVWPLVSAGKIADVAAYCADDVEQARANYKRMTFQTLPVAA